jgi:hypothetical protein
MDSSKFNSNQLLMAFAKYCNGIHGKGRDYKSPKITVDRCEFEYYFSKAEVKKIIQSSGSIEIGFTESLYRFEAYLEDFIQATTEEAKLPEYVDWIKSQDLKIILNKGDIILSINKSR